MDYWARVGACVVGSAFDFGVVEPVAAGNCDAGSTV